MIITEKEIVIHRPEQILDYKTIKDAIGDWLGTGGFRHPINDTPIFMYCDDHYLDKELYLNQIATHLYNFGRNKEDFHPVLGPVVLTKSVEDGESAELTASEISNIIILLGAAVGAELAIEKFTLFLQGEEETLTLSLYPVKTVEKVSFKDGKMERTEVKGFQHTMTYWHPAGFVTVDTSHPEYRKQIKENGRTAFYNKLRDQAAISFK